MKEKNGESLGTVVLLVVAMAALLYSCGNSSPNTGGAASSVFAQIVTCPTTTVTDVSITAPIASGFQPSSVSIAVNDIVRWTNNDSTTSHTVTSSTGKFDSGNVPPGHRVCMQFLATGSYGYYCSIHPVMTGNVNVQ